jgi:hypothetical protein
MMRDHNAKYAQCGSQGAGVKAAMQTAELRDPNIEDAVATSDTHTQAPARDNRHKASRQHAHELLASTQAPAAPAVSGLGARELLSSFQQRRTNNAGSSVAVGPADATLGNDAQAWAGAAVLQGQTEELQQEVHPQPRSHGSAHVDGVSAAGSQERHVGAGLAGGDAQQGMTQCPQCCRLCMLVKSVFSTGMFKVRAYPGM